MTNHTITLECGCVVEIPGGRTKFQPEHKRGHEETCPAYRAIRDRRRAEIRPYHGGNRARTERFRRMAELKDRIRDRSEG
jgi:hypothetical protein